MCRCRGPGSEKFPSSPSVLSRYQKRTFGRNISKSHQPDSWSSGPGCQAPRPGGAGRRRSPRFCRRRTVRSVLGARGPLRAAPGRGGGRLGRPVGGALGQRCGAACAEPLEPEPRNPRVSGAAAPRAWRLPPGLGTRASEFQQPGREVRARGGERPDPHAPADPATPARPPHRRQVDSAARREKAPIVPTASCHTPDLLFCVPRIEMQTSRVCRRQSAGPRRPRPTASCRGRRGVGGEEGV